MSKRYLVIAAEVLVAVVLAYALTAYTFLSFWAHRLPFNDIIAWTVIILATGVSVGLVYAFDQSLIKHISRDDSDG